ncbi:MAG: DUF222 domain-containing protein [Nocardioidaceae bacterium]
MEAPSTPIADRTDPVHGFAGAALAALDRVADSPGWAMTPAEQAEALVELTRVQARVAELRWRVLAAADRNQVGATDGHTSTASWLAAATRQTRTRCHGDLRGALLLDDPRHTVTRDAFAAGALTEDQTWVILRTVTDLPAEEVSEEQRVRAQEHLVALAAVHDAKTLRILAKRIFEVLAPDQADQREGQALQAEEHRARQQCRFALRDNGDGTHTGWFKLPTLHAEILTKAVQAFAAPRRTNPTTSPPRPTDTDTDADAETDGRRVPYPVRLGHAFADLIEHLPVDRLPQAGGTAATLVITLDLATLLSGLGAASLDTGTRISATQARRLACNAGLVPAVLGTDSVPLDLGRKTRLHTPHQRTAMALRDQGCTTHGCDRPPAWCEAHHELPWSHGGHTTLDNGRLLCPHHHRLAHDPGHDMHLLPDGKVRFHKRA